MSCARLAVVVGITIITGCWTESLRSPTKAESPESVTQQLLELLNETAGVLATVKDPNTAQAAAGQLQGLAQKRNDLQSQLNRLKQQGMDQEEDRRLQQKYASQLMNSMQRVAQEVKRLQGNPQVWSIIAPHAQQIMGGPAAGGGVAQPTGPALGIAATAATEHQLVATYGRHRVVTLLVEGVPGDVAAFISDRMRSICRPAMLTISTEGTTTCAVFGPVDDIRGLTSKIDFGSVLESDPTTGLVRVQADPARLPKPLAAVVAEPGDPNFYRQNCADLTCFDTNRVRGAVERLAQAEPRALRAEIAAAAQTIMRHEDVGIRKTALDVVARYSEGDITPVMLDALQDADSGVRKKAVTYLLEKGDPRSYESLAGVIAKDRSLAVDALRNSEAVAQALIGALISHQDVQVRMEAVKLAREAGRAEIVPQLLPALTDQEPAVRREAIAVLERFPDQRAVVPLCGLLLSPEDRNQAVRCLQKMGPMVEDTVIKGLNHSDPAVVQACCQVLERAGTQKSLPALEPLLRHADRSVQTAAKRAGERIMRLGRRSHGG
jgi:HEAT repeat protein